MAYDHARRDELRRQIAENDREISSIEQSLAQYHGTTINQSNLSAHENLHNRLRELRSRGANLVDQIDRLG